MKKFFLLLPLIPVAAFLLFYLFNPLTVTVDGIGQVEAVPNNVTVAFAFSARNEAVNQAQLSVSTKIRVVEGMLKAFDIAEKDIVRSQVVITPAVNSQSGQTYYTAVISMGVKMNSYEKVGDLVSSLYSNGASYVGQPVLSVEENSQLEYQALDDALNKAKLEAGYIARRNFKFFMKRVAIVQKTATTTSAFTGGSYALTADQNQGFKITQTVSVTYKMW